MLGRTILGGRGAKTWLEIGQLLEPPCSAQAAFLTACRGIIKVRRFAPQLLELWMACLRIRDRRSPAQLLIEAKTYSEGE